MFCVVVMSETGPTRRTELQLYVGESVRQYVYFRFRATNLAAFFIMVRKEKLVCEYVFACVSVIHSN
jgi:hypothetical protein